MSLCAVSGLRLPIREKEIERKDKLKPDSLDFLLIMFNKAALSSYQFPYVNVITLLQLICSCLFLYVMKRWKIISFTTEESVRTFDDSVTLVPFKALVQTLPLALSYLLYMLVSMESVRGISVPMYTTLRRTTVAFTMVVEYLVAGQKHTFNVVGSVAIIILGAFVAGARDLSFDFYSYGVVLLSNLCTAVYLTSIARLGKSSGLNSFGLMWCNGIICGPILLLWTYLQGDLQMLLSFSDLSTLGFQAIMLLSCVMAFLLNYTVFWNTTLNSALTQTICGNLKLAKGGQMADGDDDFYSIDMLLFEEGLQSDPSGGHENSVFFTASQAEEAVRKLKPELTLDKRRHWNKGCEQSIYKNEKQRRKRKDRGLGLRRIEEREGVDAFNILGQGIGFLGSCFYAFCKLKGK
ncbi:Nucleotide-sugar uncharacterized transporter 3 [Bienertia sinuspersici]